MLDLGATIRYSITRDISFRAGVDLNYAWQGFARVDTRTQGLNPYFSPLGLIGGIPDTVNDEDLILAGFNFGIDWRR